MVKIFNVILIISVLVALYFCIQKQNDKQQINNERITENFNTDKLFFNETEPTKKIQFNYGKLRPIDKQFLKEQDLGVSQKSWYPNTWIDHIDEVTGEPVYGSRENPNIENFIESKARFSYEFNSPRSVQMDGVADPLDFKNNQGRTIQEIYENSFVDYKKLVPQKKKLDLDGIIPSKNAGSNLSFIEPDNWVYENEKPENGGRFDDGVFASDPYSANSISNSHAMI